MTKFKEERFINQRYSKSGTWTFQVVIRTPGKETVTKSFSEKKYGSARRAFDAAIQFRNEVLFTHSQGVYIKQNDSITIEDVLYESFDLFPVRESTKKKMILLFGKYISNYNQPISKINRTIVIESLNKMIRECSTDTIQRILSIWRRIATTGIAKEYIIIDFTAGVVAPKSQRIEKEKRKVITTRETLDEVIDAIHNKFVKSEIEPVCTALEVMWYTGMRPAECFALNKDDIKDGIIKVNKELGSDIADASTKIDTDNINIVRRCKTDASVRSIPISSKLQSILDNYECESEILFPNRNGYYFNITNLGARIKNLGIPFNMYQLRHTVSTNLITNNVDQRTVIEILGHEKIDMSVYYARSNDNLKKDALDNI